MTDRSCVTVFALAALLCLPALRPAIAEEVMAQSASPLEIPSATPPQSPVPPASAPEESPPAMEEENGDSPDNQELSLGEIPIIETIELTPDLAKRALDSYISAREKFVNSDLEQFENLQDFVDQTEDGKAFEADIKAAGFANVTDWNLAITTLGLTYGSIVDDQTPDLLHADRGGPAGHRDGAGHQGQDGEGAEGPDPVRQQQEGRRGPVQRPRLQRETQAARHRGRMNRLLVATHEAGVLRLTLNDPATRNSLSEAMMAELHSALEQAASDKPCG
jgi:hypothetical protein